MSQEIITAKLEEISNAIAAIGEVEPAYGHILLEGFGLSLDLINEVTQNKGVRQMDVSEHLRIVTNILGFSLEDLVMAAMPKQEETTSNKEVDQATLDFITSDLDDYEKFLAQNKAKEDLDFLSKSI
jgi:N-dimethylarginine dimethylaminohydrolase